MGDLRLGILYYRSWTGTSKCQQHFLRSQANQESQVGIPGIWSLINSIRIALGRPLHPGAQIALDCIFKVDLWFYGILGLIRETSSYYQGDGYAEGSQWNMVVAALSLMRWLSVGKVATVRKA